MANFYNWNSSRCPQFIPRYGPAFQTWCASSHISIKNVVVKGIFVVYNFNHVICLMLNVTLGPCQQKAFRGLSNSFFLSSFFLDFLK